MLARNFILLWALFSVAFSCTQSPGGEAPYAARIDSLINVMTLEEKLGQLNLPSAGDITTGLAQSTGIVENVRLGKVGGLFNISGLDQRMALQKVAVEESRLGIPLIFGMDVIHGYKTAFPIPLGLSCTWDMGMVEESARIAATEATADGVCWTFSPMTDISRDPRWGRIAEGVGEDPYLGYEIAAAMVRGYQGEDLSDNNTMMACVKHFALYGASEAGRDYNTVDMGRLRMFNEYFPPYKGALDAGVGSVMASFNELDGIPAHGNKWLLTEVLRDRWGFDGFVVSDYTGINEMIAHGMGDLPKVSALALKAGVDMDMVGEGFLTTLEASLESGEVSLAEINQACRRVLEAKFKLGLFEDPYRYLNEERSQQLIFTDEHRARAREIAAHSCVLLKNEDVLPLAKNGRIALIGPLVSNKENMLGTWSVGADPKMGVSLEEGLQAVVGDEASIISAKGANVVSDPDLEARFSIFGKPTQRDDRSDQALRQEALSVARQSDVIVAALGEASEMSGESSSRTSIEIPENQRELLQALLATGKPVVLVVFTGRPLALTWEQENVPAILNVWFGGTETGHAVADVLFGDVNPSGRLTVTFPRNLGQVPIFYNHKNTGRPLETEWFQKFRSNYLDVPNSPLYPFGYGLSYTEFEYGPLALSDAALSGEEDTLEVSVEVTNRGELAGHEVVQLYIRDMVGSTTRPVQELKGFRKIYLEPGQTEAVTFRLSVEDLKYYTYDTLDPEQEIVYRWEPGEFRIMVGPNAGEVQIKTVKWE